jgi:hypothetical protein
MHEDLDPKIPISVAARNVGVPIESLRRCALKNGLVTFGSNGEQTIRRSIAHRMREHYAAHGYLWPASRRKARSTRHFPGDGLQTTEHA